MWTYFWMYVQVMDPIGGFLKVKSSKVQLYDYMILHDTTLYLCI